MPSLPSALFVVDVGVENIAVSEAIKLKIPVIGVVDTNNDPGCVDYMMPGNDDSIRAIKLYVQSAAAAILEGKSQQLSLEGVSEDDFVEMTDEADLKPSQPVTDTIPAAEPVEAPSAAVAPVEAPSEAVAPVEAVKVETDESAGAAKAENSTTS
jgi:small subunit ribosomal protein S2